MAKKLDNPKTILSGTIFGFKPSIYNLVPYYGKLDEMWSSSILETFSENDKIQFTLKWQNSTYVVNVKVFDKIKYQGRIIRDGNAVGTIYLTAYENRLGKVLTGNWVEDGLDYDIFIELHYSDVK